MQTSTYEPEFVEIHSLSQISLLAQLFVYVCFYRHNKTRKLAKIINVVIASKDYDR